MSPLGARASISVAVIVFGAPACLLVLREQSTVGPARLLAGVLRWRARAQLLEVASDAVRLRSGGVCLADETSSGRRRRRTGSRS